MATIVFCACIVAQAQSAPILLDNAEGKHTTTRSEDLLCCTAGSKFDDDGAIEPQSGLICHHAQAIAAGVGKQGVHVVDIIYVPFTVSETGSYSITVRGTYSAVISNAGLSIPLIPGNDATYFKAEVESYIQTAHKSSLANAIGDYLSIYSTDTKEAEIRILTKAAYDILWILAGNVKDLKDVVEIAKTLFQISDWAKTNLDPVFGPIDKSFSLSPIAYSLEEGKNYYLYISVDSWCKAFALGGNLLLSDIDITLQIEDIRIDKTGPTDAAAPEPDPMTWHTKPYATSTSSISMRATTASDDVSTPIEYYFDCGGSPTGGSGGDDSVWQTSTYYADNGLDVNHQYKYRVKARDAVGNETGYSGWSYEYTYDSQSTTHWTQATGSAPWSNCSGNSSIVYDGKIWVIGGTKRETLDFGFTSVSFSVGQSDVWCSPDGKNWIQVTDSAPWGPRQNHTSVVYDDKMWVIGGYAHWVKRTTNSWTPCYKTYRDIWCSSDGVNWSQVTDLAPGGVAPGGAGYASVIHDGKMWLLGGSEVCYSTDGVTWYKATDSAPGGAGYASVIHDGKMWLLGENEVWYSADGVTWNRTTDSAGWFDRIGHTSVVFDDRIWIFGGKDGNGQNLDDAWYSYDGINWTKATYSPGWPARFSHTSVVHNSRMWVIGGITDSPDYEIYSDVWYSPPVPKIISSHESVIVPEGETATFQVKLSAQPPKTIIISVARTSGDSDISVRSGSSLTFSTSTWNTYQTVTLEAAHDADYENGQATIRCCASGVSDKDLVAWEQDDETSIGAEWVQATDSAPWAGRICFTSVVFDGKIWIMGGFNEDDRGYDQNLSDVWCSTDGVSWHMVTDSTPWGCRYGHTSIVFDNKMWVIGGDRDDSTYDGMCSDVWYSQDGHKWTQSIESAPWTARTRHTSVVYDNKMWVIGGLIGRDSVSDVWYSENGQNWIQAVGSAPWSKRKDHTSVVYDNKMWIIGGSIGLGNDFRDPVCDVWSSTNGRDWNQISVSNFFTPLRVSYASVVYDDKIWLIGGLIENRSGRSCFSDVWYSNDGGDWGRATNSAVWGARGGHSSVVFHNKIWILGGVGWSSSPDDIDWKNDVWFSPSVSMNSISGKVTLNGGTASVTDVLLTLTGAARLSTYPGETGQYSFTGLEEGNYTVTPSLTGYHFLPDSLSYSPLESSQTDQDFVGWPNITPSTKRLLSVSSGEYAVHPSYSPDGTKISYGMYSPTGGFGIWVMNSDGSGVSQIIVKDVFPADWAGDIYLFLSNSWSPDGRKIAYTGGEGTRRAETFDIWTINSDRSGTPLQITKAGFAIMPSWSPDGEKIAYVEPEDDQTWAIWLVNSDGTGTAERITNSGMCVWPNWSPDGRRIAYTSYSMESKNTDLWVVNSDGSRNPSKIVSDAFLPSSSDDYALLSRNHWSPDGARICYTSDAGIDKNAELWVTNSDGSGTPQPVVSNADVGVALCVFPVWSADGTKIVYANYVYANYHWEYSDIYVADYLYGNDAVPAVNIVSPILNQQVWPKIDVIGTAADNISVDATTVLSSLSSWTLEYGKGEQPETWTNIVTSSTRKFNELLASWDTSALPSGKYTLRLRATDGIHESVQSVTVTVRPLGFELDADEVSDIPNEYALAQNFPNPFNPITEIRYQLPEASEVQIVICDLLGREVRCLVDERVEAGTHSVVWDGRDDLGRKVGSGVYLVRMEAREFVEVRKSLLLR